MSADTTQTLRAASISGGSPPAPATRQRASLTAILNSASGSGSDPSSLALNARCCLALATVVFDFNAGAARECVDEAVKQTRAYASAMRKAGTELSPSAQIVGTHLHPVYQQQLDELEIRELEAEDRAAALDAARDRGDFDL